MNYKKIDIIFIIIETLLICRSVIQMFVSPNDTLYVFQKKQYYLMLLSMIIALLNIIYILFLRLLFRVELTKINGISVLIGFIALLLRSMMYCFSIM